MSTIISIPGQPALYPGDLSTLSSPAPQGLTVTLADIAPGMSDPEAVERLREQEAHVPVGMAIKPPLYAPGTRVLPVGAGNFRRSRHQFEALPPAPIALRQFIHRIALEQRQDVTVPVRSLRMLEDGSLSRGGGGRLIPSEESLDQLLRRTECPEPGAASTYLATIPPDRRARELNHWLEATPEETLAVLRTRNNIGVDGKQGRAIFAAVSPRFSAYDVDALALLMLEEVLFPGDARAEVEYDGRKARITLRWHSDIQPETAAAGEIFRACAGVTTADDGTLALNPWVGLDRNLCLNLLIVDQARMSLATKRHTGGGIATHIGSALAQAVDHVRWFAQRWDEGRSQTFSQGLVRDLPDGATHEQAIQGVLRGLLVREQVALPGMRRPQALDTLLQAYRQEPEPTRVGVVNAVSRAAHTADLRGPWATNEVEAQASKILASDRPLQWVGEDLAF